MSTIHQWYLYFLTHFLWCYVFLCSRFHYRLSALVKWLRVINYQGTINTLQLLYHTHLNSAASNGRLIPYRSSQAKNIDCIKGLAPFPCADTLWAAWRHRHSARSLLPALVAVRVILPPLWNSLLLVYLWDTSYYTTQLRHIYSAERYPPYILEYKIRSFWLDNGHVCIGINSKSWKIWGCRSWK